jgi:hypothetical protein
MVLMTFYVNGIIWLLKFVRPGSRHLRRSDGTYTLGVTDDNSKTVFIADNLPGQMTDKVICHEMCHVYSFSNRLDMPIETEEIIADFLSRYGRDIVYMTDSIMNQLLRGIA